MFIIFEGHINHLQIIREVCFYFLRKASPIGEIIMQGLEKAVMFSWFKWGTFGDVFSLNLTHN